MLLEEYTFGVNLITAGLKELEERILLFTVLKQLVYHLLPASAETEHHRGRSLWDACLMANRKCVIDTTNSLFMSFHSPQSKPLKY